MPEQGSAREVDHPSMAGNKRERGRLVESSLGSGQWPTLVADAGFVAL